MLGDCALFPSDFGVREIRYDSGDCGSDEIRKPYEIVVFDDEIGKNCEEGIIEAGDTNTHYEVTKGVPGGFDVFGGLCMGGFF